MSSKERSGYTPQEAQLPDKETYDVAGPVRYIRKVEANPKKLEKFTRAASGRAEDIFESGKIAERIHEGDKVLYLGTGTGHVAKYIEDHTGAKVFKFDLADLRTPDTKDNKFAKANARHIPVADSSLDVVCLMDILHHTNNQEEILREVKRVLKPGGKCLLMEDTVPEEFQRGAGFKKWLVGKMDDTFNQQPKGINPHNYRSISEWESVLRKEGYVVDDNKTNSWHWGIPDFMGADRRKRPPKPTTFRPFQATMFEVVKPSGKNNEV